MSAEGEGDGRQGEGKESAILLCFSLTICSLGRLSSEHALARRLAKQVIDGSRGGGGDSLKAERVAEGLLYEAKYKPRGEGRKAEGGEGELGGHEVTLVRWRPGEDMKGWECGWGGGKEFTWRVEMRIPQCRKGEGVEEFGGNEERHLVIR